MKFYKKNNKVYAFNDLQVKKGIGEEFIPITESEANELRTPVLTTEDENNIILAQIAEKEASLVRPMRELLSTSTTQEVKVFAQTKIDTLEAEIQVLRSQLNES